MISVIIAIIVFIIGLICIAKNIKEQSKDEEMVIGTICILIAGICLGYFIFSSDIKPIDVYRGKTELQIEEKVINNVVVSTDTTVILK